MKRTDKGTPVISWILSVRNCETTLEACLKSLRERTPQAEIVIVDNMSRDGTPELAAKYADVFDRYRGPKGTWTEDDPHTYDMAASRQHGFDLASGRWRAWADSDDRIPGPEETEKLLKLNNRWKPGTMGVKDPDAPSVTLEELLLRVEKEAPDADCILAPYLYARDKDDQALIWQERERIIKWSNPPRWHWAEAAHEILVPVPGYKPKQQVFFAHLLFLHEREHSEQANNFAVKRHFDVLYRQYQEGDRTTRRCLYLAAYARELCPEREREFVDEARRLAASPNDRYRSLSAAAALFARQGLFNDALEVLGAATYFRPELPDVWLQGGEVFFNMEDYSRAIEWMEKGLKLSPSLNDSYMNPRNHAVKYPTLLADAYVKIAESQKKMGCHVEAKCSLDRAEELWRGAKDSPAIGRDARQANSGWCRVDNARKAQEFAVYIKGLGEYLIANDEPKKALSLLEAIPWNLEDHPLLLDLGKRLRPIARHISDKEAYRKFYASDLETGYVESKDSWLEPDKTLDRVKWTANVLNAFAPNAAVLDVGCYDGLITIPLLKLCPGITYVGVDIYQKSVDNLNARIAKLGFDGRAQAILVKDLSELRRAMIVGREADLSGKFDAALWFEVIEHVPDPVEYLEKIAGFLKPTGKLFVTTPWGSFDAGHPPKTTDHGTPRDSRNHLRVLTPRNIVDQVRAAAPVVAGRPAALEVEDLHRQGLLDDNLGDALHMLTSIRPRDPAPPAGVSFVVPGALWDWSGRTLDAGGMGASEKSIVQVASALATDYRRTEVYGPTPEETVYRGVPYWPLSQLRHIKDGKLVVSRSPSYAAGLDEEIGRKLPKILWLQDAWYNDLPDTWKEYEKIVVVSKWHKEAMHEYHGVPLDRMEVIYNPVDPSLYRIQDPPARKRDRFVYCSSPDRGLLPLLRLWPRILKALPEATLEVFYGFRGAQKLGTGSDTSWTKRYESCRREFEQLRFQSGVTVHGMVDPVTLSRMFLSAGVWAYPVIDFTETCCTAALEARAAGCVPVAPPLAALAETADCVQGFLTPLASIEGWEGAFVEACVAATKVGDQERAVMAAEAQQVYSIDVALGRWRKVLGEQG